MWRGAQVSTGLIAALAVLSLLWVGYHFLAVIALDHPPLSPTFYRGYVLWSCGLLLLNFGVVLGAAGAIVAYVYTATLGYISIEQVIFCVVMTGVCANYGDAWLRRGFAATSGMIALYMAGQIDDSEAGMLVVPIMVALCLVAYLVGWMSRSQREQRLRAQEFAFQARSDHERRFRLLARELHDRVASDLSVIATDASESKRAEEKRELILQRARSAHKQLRRIMRLLELGESPSGESPLGEADIRAQLRNSQGILESLGVDVEVEMSGEPGELSGSARENICAILDEAVNNVIKYGDRSENARCIISISVDSDAVDIVLRNTVEGENARIKVGTQMGLQGLRNRADAYGAKLDYGHENQDSWRLEVKGHAKC